jgi:hypothetical protein
MLNKKQYAAAPAMIMAFGIFINFALRFLLERTVGGWTAAVLRVLSCLLVLLAAWVFLTIYRRFREDRSIIWKLESSHFVLGVWAAGLNVASAAVAANTPLAWLARALNLAAWAFWLLYMCWFVRLLRTGQGFRKTIFGSAFLLTVSTQSTIVGTLSAWGPVPGMARFFLAFNLLGLAFYLYVFILVWVLRGPAVQWAEWRPANNITHGALSITVLALENVAVRYGSIPWAVPVLNAMWATATLFFLAILAAELRLAFSARRAAIFDFQYGNYARNFTYGMYFACTRFGFRNVEGFLAQRLFSEGLFLALALLVLAANLWEGIRHFVFFLQGAAKWREIRASRLLGAQARRTPSREE